MKNQTTLTLNFIAKGISKISEGLIKTIKSYNKIFLFGCFFLLFTAFTVQASTFTSITNGDWNSPSTWDLNGVPDVDNWPNDKVIIKHAVTKNGGITMNGSSSRITINIGGSLSITGTLNVGSGQLHVNFGGSLSGGVINLNTSNTCGLNGTITSSGNMELDGTFNGSPTIIVGGNLLAGLQNKNQIFGTLNLQVIGNMIVQNANFRWSSGAVTVGGNFTLTGSGDVDIPNGGSLEVVGNLSVNSNLTIDGPSGAQYSSVVSWGGSISMSGNNKGLNNCPLSYTSPFDLSTCSQASAADITAPVITLLGNATETVSIGTTYADAGATATDETDGNLTSIIATSSNVDENTVGSYTVTYNVSDSAGNTATSVVRTVNVVVAPEITVNSNSVEIIDGDNTPSASDNTNFGSVVSDNGSVTNTFTILNSGSGVLDISNVTSSDSQFTIAQPSSTTILSGSSVSFTITFDPSATGNFTSSIVIPNNDTDENPYNFNVTGEGTDTPFNCDYNAYLFQYNDIYALDLASGASYLVKENIISSGSINGIGYNPADGYMWGSLSSPTKTIIRIGKNFNTQTFQIPELGIDNGYIGDISNAGLYYLKSSGDIYYVMDVNPNSSSYGTYLTSKTLSQYINIHDWAFNAVDGQLYTVEKNSNKLYKIDSETGVVTNLGLVPILSGLNYTYGAVYFDVDGRFYISANQTGTVYVINNVQNLDTTSTIQSNLFAFGPSSSQNDGARCPTAPVPQEDCINGVDDDGDGLVDCDDPSCSGVSECPVIETEVSTGNNGGLESNDRLSVQINKRNYLRSKRNYVFDKLKAKKLEKTKIDKKVAVKNNNFSLKDLIPMDVIAGTQAIESSPTDLIAITNATELFSVDYVRNDKTVAVILATKTENGVYEHTKYICDRLLGAELLAVSTIEIREQTFIKSIIKNANGTKEFVLSFSGKVTNNNSNFEIESHWNIDKYEQNATFYNFQIWTNSIDDLITLGEEALELFNAQRAIDTYKNSSPPPVFVKKGRYINGALELVIINTNRSQDVVFDAGFKRTETSATEYSNSSIALNGNYISSMVINTGNIFDIGFRIESGTNQTPDDLFMSDGPWGVDHSSDATTLDSFIITQNDDIYSGDGYRVERNISLEATTNTYVAAYRSFTPGFKPINLSDKDVLELDAFGTGDLEITITKKGIETWENQFRTTITLTDTESHYAIPLEYFTSKNNTVLDLSDAVSMVFTLSSNGTDVVKKEMNIKNIEFTQNVLSLNEDVVEENETLLFPNPMSSKTEIRFYSEVQTSSKIEVYNLTGALVKKVTIDTEIGNNKIEILREGLSKGLYFIKVSNDYRHYKVNKLVIN